MKSKDWVPLKYQENLNKEVKRNNPYVEDCFLTVTFHGSENSANHSVSIFQGYTFHGNCIHAMKLANKLLDWCFSDPVFPALFVQYCKAFYYFPKAIRK